MSAPSPCRLCGLPLGAPLLALGPQPVCSRFLRSPEEAEYRHPLELFQCGRCGLLQLGEPVPVAELVPRFAWLSYQEPEGHLDDLVETLFALPGMGPGATAAGVSYKDDSTLRRLERLGCATWRVAPAADLGTAAAHAEIETVQARLDPAAAREIVARRGGADLVLARHVLEHTHDTGRFLAALAGLARRGGGVVCEVPDCAPSLERLDYTVLWEEHTLYFTPATFRGAFPQHGMGLERQASYPYPLEPSLVALARPGADAGEPWPAADVLAGELERGRRFAAAFPARRDAWRAHLGALRDRGEKVALLGAGHLACTFLNLFGLAELVAFVADDNPQKAGLLMPGSRLPIRPSAALAEEGVRLCLLAVSAAAERKVAGSQRGFLAQGGRFASIFPGSELALRLPEG